MVCELLLTISVIVLSDTGNNAGFIVNYRWLHCTDSSCR